MSILKAKPEFWKIREAVIKNTCRPLPSEKTEHDMKSLRVSIKREGDSQVGIMLLIGIALELGFTYDEINVFEGVEAEEIGYKSERYKDRLEADKKFAVKRLLVINYLKLNV